MVTNSKPEIGLWYRSRALMKSFIKAIYRRTHREAVLEVQRDYQREQGLHDIHRRELDVYVTERLSELERGSDGH